MALQYVISTGATSLLTTTIKTMIECPTSSTVPFVVYALEVGANLVSAGSITLSWWSFTTTGVGTTVTPLKWGVDQSVAAVTGTIKINDTTEPTGTLTQLTTVLIPLPGMYSIIYPFGRETYVPISTLRCLRATVSSACSVSINMYIEQ